MLNQAIMVLVKYSRVGKGTRGLGTGIRMATHNWAIGKKRIGPGKGRGHWEWGGKMVGCWGDGLDYWGVIN